MSTRTKPSKQYQRCHNATTAGSDHKAKQFTPDEPQVQQKWPQNMAALSGAEVEHIVEKLRTFPVEEVGSPQWLSQILLIEKLNLTAHVQAANNQFESVVDAINTFDKFEVIVHELLAADMFNTKCVPKFKDRINQLAFARLYMTTRSPATLLNLVELITFHPENLPDGGLIPLVDFCSQKIAMLSELDLADFNEETRPAFSLGFAALSVLWCIASCPELPLSVMKRLVEEDDVVPTLCQLITKQPWRTVKRGKIQKWENEEVKELPRNEALRVCKPEAHAWTALQQLLGSKYLEITRWNQYRKDILLGVEDMLSDVLIDQLPPLENLRAVLQWIRVTDLQPPKFSAMIQQVPEMVDEFAKERDFKKIAENALRKYYISKPEILQRELMQLSDFFDIFQGQ